jgi:hypothetical protein
MLKKKTGMPSPATMAAAVKAVTKQIECDHLREFDRKLDDLERRINLFQTVLDNPDMPAAQVKKILAQVSNRKTPVPKKRVTKKKTEPALVFVPSHVRVVMKAPAKAAAKVKPASKPAKRKKK